MNIRIVSKVLLIDNSSRILLLRRSTRNKLRPLEWDVPGGHADGNEYPAEAAARETFEEAGIRVDARELLLVYAMTEQFEEGLSVTWLFHLARTKESNVILSSEHCGYAWTTLDEALQRITYERQKRALLHLQTVGMELRI